MNRSITDVFRNPQHDLLPMRAAEMAALWSRTSILDQVRGIVQAVAAWPRVTITPNRAGLCLALGSVTLGRLNWNGRINLPFPPKVSDKLMAERMVNRDPHSEGVVFDVRTMADVDRAVWLLRLAYLIGDSKADVCGSDTVSTLATAYAEHHGSL